MTDPADTRVSDLLRAAEIGLDAGLRFVYAGNIPGRVQSLENTYCPGCRELLVERIGYRVRRNTLVDGRCPRCSRPIPGVWSDGPEAA